MWDPFTLKALQYLKGHNTSVQDLAINEERSHLISLGTDKVVKVWDTKTYLLIQTIIDRTQYRPSDELNSLLFDEVSKSILVGSRKINFWPFKTQEEIKTSHEYSVAFALYNTQFEQVISGDDGGIVSVWDIETGRIVQKFAHGEGNKITAGSFDSTKRRLITAASDGSVKIWNFSNGSCLKDMLNKDGKQKVDQEITALVCIHEPL